MSLHGNDVCLLEVDDYNLYEEETSDHAFIGDKHRSSGGKTMEAEKRIRREIANSNERRRMQSINAGFQALRTLLPRHEGEKLSKAAILQQTAEYIYSLEQEKTRLLSQNCQLKRLLNQHEGGEIPLKKRKTDIITHVSTIIPDSTDDTVATRIAEPVIAVKKDNSDELRTQLERERRLRRVLEQQLRSLHTPQVAAEQPIAVRIVEEVDVKPTVVEMPVVVAVAPPAAEREESVKGAEAKAPLLEAAVKAEPPVQVELLPDAPSRLYLASTSRQNLETIVEAIRHLEGDHLFGEESADVPLALTKKADRPQPPPRPGVIVVKHT